MGVTGWEWGTQTQVGIGGCKQNTVKRQRCACGVRLSGLGFRPVDLHVEDSLEMLHAFDKGLDGVGDEG